jgi:phosphatidate cytidylyltransferase
MNKELKKRIITSIVLIAILLNCLFISKESWLVLLAIISIISFSEFFNLIKKVYKKLFSRLILLTICFLVLLLFNYSAYKIRIEYGEMVIIFILLICIFSDIGGYVVGKSVGGKKLTKISPNKTISGSVGSFLFSFFPIGIYGLLSIITNKDFFKFALDDKSIAVCLVLSLTCQIGDLLISFFKRKAKVKDTGKILPGHGGMLDRIDGIIFAVIVSLIWI